MKKKIILISGDPNSINSEIIFKSWSKLNHSIKKKIYLISNYNLIKKQFKKLNYSIEIEKVKNINEDLKSTNLKIINLDLKFINPFNISKTNATRFVIKSLNLAHKLASKKNVLGIINCAIDKKLLKKNKIGVTEYLAKKCHVKNHSEAMLIINKKLSVCPVTTHIDVREISKKINKVKIINKIKTIDNWFKKNIKIKPKIGILGLNPHNAELREKSEEKRIIIPAIKTLKKLGIKIDGPLVSDTIFVNDYKNYDIIVGMFHDQVLGPFKALFKFDAINITLGLKYLRVSPDHGTAINLIGKNKASPTSLIKCINFVNRFKL
jgi:4-hydroxy-L-threonine phosphate dehydrogenase PdxA